MSSHRLCHYFRYIFFALILVYCCQMHIPQCYAYVDDLRRTPVVRAVDNSRSSVVSISTYEHVHKRANPFSTFGRDPFFDRFFNDFYDNRYQQEAVRTHLGSGVIIDRRGFVVTNWHVVQKAASITVTTSDEKEYAATLIGADQKSDLAVLKITSAEQFTSIPLADSDGILIGETVIAIGNPFGLSHTVTTGVVSALHRSLKANEQIYEDFIQTDASINPGNSGGPLLNINGELIGINTAIYGEAQGIGFAIPINTAKRIVDDLLRYGEVRSAWIGITVANLSAETAARFGYTGLNGVIITEVLPESPSASSGLLVNDIIISIGDQKIKSKSLFKRIIGLYTPQSTIKMDVFRQGKTYSFSVVATGISSQSVTKVLWDVFGIDIINNTSELAQKYRLATGKGVVVSKINSTGQAHTIGLKPGDIILQAQGSTLKDVDDFKNQIVKNIYQDSMVVLVQRGMYGYYITFEL